MTVVYVPMTSVDLEAVTVAERRIYRFPWTHRNFADSLAAGHEGWLASENCQMIGYAVVMPVLDEAHLLNIGVLPEFQRTGQGAALLDHLIDVARRRGASRMLLEVRAGNVPAQRLYARCGFDTIGLRRDYYSADAGREDAIVMACTL